MRENKSEQLLNYLLDNGVDTYVTAEDLSLYLDISRRQIQKYIAVLNNLYAAPCILSTPQGYTINNDFLDELKQRRQKSSDAPRSPEERQHYILQKLLGSPDGYNSFDLADELFVSTPTIESDLKNVRTQLETKDIHIRRKGEMLTLEGNEQSKRQMMIELMHNSDFNDYISGDTVEFLNFHYSLPNLAKKIRSILKDHEFYVNDYALNNLVLHLLIMVERINQNCEMDEVADLSGLKEKTAFKAGMSIVRYMENEFDIRIGDAEFQILVILLINCSSHARYTDLEKENISLYIESEYVDITKNLLEKVSEVYFLDPFNKEFIQTFSLHIKNLILRASKNYHISNPLSENIKTNYPLIYDISVFISHQLQEDFSIDIHEDEITYIAFHIGSYFENNVRNYTKVKCVFVYSDYNGFFEKQLNKILDVFENQIIIIDVFSIMEFVKLSKETDLLITMVDMETEISKVVLSPFLTDRDFQNLRSQIEKISSRKKAEQFKAYLSQFFHPENFYDNLLFATKDSLLNFMCDDMIEKEIATPSYKKDVFKREALSPTAFNSVAVPHSLSENTLESFFSFAICKMPILWDDNTKISLVVLIGINEDSREIFSQMFDYLIDILGNDLHVKKLIQCKTYDEFFDMLISLVP